MDQNVAEGLCSGQEQESEPKEGSSTTGSTRETTGSTRRVLGDGSFDKDRIIKDHELHRLVYTYMMPSTSKKPLDLGPEPNTPVLSVEGMAVIALPEGMAVITLPDLVLKKRHSDRVLYGRLCVIPFRRLGFLHTVLEDTAGRAVRVSIYNPATQRDAAKRFPSGMHVAIRGPYLFASSEGGRPSVLAYNPVPVQISDCADQIRETLEKFRAEGNELFGKKDWIGAASKYTACIDRASGITITDRDTQRHCQRSVMLAYANRAEARLQLEKYYDALNDSTRALDLDPKNMKTMVRKGRAEHALGLFQKAAKTFADASPAASNEADRSFISTSLKASEEAALQSQQSRYGYFDLTNFYLKGEPSPCSDFVGPVEIRRSNYGGGKSRGLFATRNVAPGQILLVSNPLAIARENVDKSHDPSGKRSLALKVKMDKDFVRQLVNIARNSKRCLAQLYSLGKNEQGEVEIPSMELFTPGSEWVPPGMDNLKVEVEKLTQISRTHVFSHQAVVTGEAEEYVTDVGLWVLPAFTSHSCAPNCIMVMVGEAMFFRAAREIVDGSELTIAYSDTFEGVEKRREQMSTAGYSCECERCQFEDALLTSLPKLDVMAKPELARTADNVEEVIRSFHSELEPRQQYWIRAPYMSAYYAKYELGNRQSRISTVRLMMEAMVAVSVYPAALNFSAMLLFEVELVLSTVGREALRRTEERVLEVYSNFYGMAPREFLLKCIAKHFKSSERAHLAQIVRTRMQQ